MSPLTSIDDQDAEVPPAEIEEETRVETEIATKDLRVTAPKDFDKGPWLDPTNESYSRGR